MSEIVSQLPPLTENFPLPIRVRISSGVSLGPFANGVELRTEETAFDLLPRNPAREHLQVAATDEERSNCHHGACLRARWLVVTVPAVAFQQDRGAYPASIVYRRTPRLQMSQPSS